MKKILIDCDPGIDDAQAILMAYMHPNTKIEAITSVSGNVDVFHTTKNILKILDVLGDKTIPVFPGAASPLVERVKNASYFHGIDGLGDVGIPDSERSVEIKPAAVGLIQYARENPGEIELIALGPLTNLALALRLDPDLPKLFRRLVIMGGAYLGKGNTINFPAEFNIFSDPDAASVVFNNWPKFTLVTWEATLSHGIPFDRFEEFLHYNNPRSVFLEQISRKMISSIKKFYKNDKYYAPDPLAMAVLLEPGVVVESEDKFVQVERFGHLTRGMTVVDWQGASKREPNASIVYKVDDDRFENLLRMAFQ